MQVCSKHVSQRFSLIKTFFVAVVRGCSADFSADICEQGVCFECDKEDGCNNGNIVSINMVVWLLSFVLSSIFISS